MKILSFDLEFSLLDKAILFISPCFEFFIPVFLFHKPRDMDKMGLTCVNAVKSNIKTMISINFWLPSQILS